MKKNTKKNTTISIAFKKCSALKKNGQKFIFKIDNNDLHLIFLSGYI
jgi:hypothetical protein